MGVRRSADLRNHAAASSGPVRVQSHDNLCSVLLALDGVKGRRSLGVVVPSVFVTRERLETSELILSAKQSVPVSFKFV